MTGPTAEVHSIAAQGRPYGRATDVWALGCILYELCALRRAFDGSNLGAITVKIMRRAPLKDQPASTRHRSLPLTDDIRSYVIGNFNQKHIMRELSFSILSICIRMPTLYHVKEDLPHALTLCSSCNIQFAPAPECCSAELMVKPEVRVGFGPCAGTRAPRMTRGAAGPRRALTQRVIRSGKFAPLPDCYSAELRALCGDLLQRDPERRPALDAVLARPLVRRHLGALAARVRAGGMRRQASFERMLRALRLSRVRLHLGKDKPLPKPKF